VATTIKKIETKIPACPFTREGCTGACCACWNDDWGCCSVSAVGIYHQMREAATDAAVEVIGAYKEDVTQRTVPVILEGEARVMTLEEIRTLPKDCGFPVCVEQRYPIGKYNGGSYIKWLGSGFVNEEYMTDNRFYNPKTYNIDWRCWSAKPTDAQRERQPWN
jgi:hypothetical protein